VSRKVPHDLDTMPRFRIELSARRLVGEQRAARAAGCRSDRDACSLLRNNVSGPVAARAAIAERREGRVRSPFGSIPTSMRREARSRVRSARPQVLFSADERNVAGAIAREAPVVEAPHELLRPRRTSPAGGWSARRRREHGALAAADCP